MRTVWVFGVLDGMSSRLNQFGLPSRCLNTVGMVLSLCNNTKLLSNMYDDMAERRLSCEMMWLGGDCQEKSGWTLGWCKVSGRVLEGDKVAVKNVED
jgi:hypothetical protein